MLDSFNSNPAANWKSKDAAMYLVTSLATRAKTAKHGITQTNQLVNLSEFCAAHVAPELHNLSNMAQFPILKVNMNYFWLFKRLLCESSQLIYSSLISSLIQSLASKHDLLA